MRKTLLVGVLTAFVSTWMFVGSALATPLVLDQGTGILLVDGNDDSNVTVSLASTDAWDGYYLKYSVNGSAWSDVTDWGSDLFTGGDVLDFALVGTNNAYYGTTANEFYILSNDSADDSFSVTMEFVGELDSSLAQQPVMQSSYYKDVFINWNIVQTGYTFSNSIAISSNEQGWNDGVAPVPEPATMLLFGTGLVGLAGVARRKKK